MIAELDRYQRAHRWLGFPLAVAYKFLDDLGSYQAALLTYYGFVSLFPLLLLAVTVLGYVLAGDPGAQQAVLDSALRNVPVIGQEIGANVHALHGSVPALIVGAVVSLYGALGITTAISTIMSQIWEVPVAERPGLAVAYGRGVLALGALAVGLVTTTALSALSTAVGDSLPAPLTAPIVRAAPAVVSAGVNAATFLVGYRVLTPRPLRWRQLAPGAGLAALAWQGLQLVGTYLIGHELQGSSATYGLFGIVLGLMVWLYLGALLVVLCAQVNAVRVLGLTPRSLLSVAVVDDPDVTVADRRAYRAYADTQRYKTYQRVEVAFDQPGRAGTAPDDGQPREPSRPRAAAGALFLDDDRVLLVHPTYKPGWEVPGGVVEQGESPATACRRELREELGVDRPPRRLLGVDWVTDDVEGDKLLFLFDVGPLGGDEERIVLGADELDRWAWVPVADLDAYVRPRLARRVATLALGGGPYLEHGVMPDDR